MPVSHKISDFSRDDANLAEVLAGLLCHPAPRFHEMTAAGEYPPASYSAQDLPAHLAGEITLALELVNDAGLVKAALLDFDGGPAQWPTVLRVRAALAELGLPPLPVSVSGGKGYGLWLFFADALPVAQVQRFLRLVRAAYFPEIEQALYDLRPDVSGYSESERISGKAVAKFPPCLHRKSGKWSAFLSTENNAETMKPPHVGLEQRPDLAQQAALLAQVQRISSQAFLHALDALQQRTSTGSSAEGPAYFPKFTKLESGKHPACISALLEKGAPHGLDYNTANLNLAAYASTRGLDEDAAEALARTMAEASSEHPTGKKSTEQKLRNFRSNQRPRPFACDYARNTGPWAELFGGRAACRSCPANPGLPSDKPASRTSQKLEATVARELLAWAWKKQEPLPPLNRIWPSVSVATAGGSRAVGLYEIAAQAASTAAASAYFGKLDSLIAESRSHADAPAIRAAAEAFLADLLALEVPDAAGRAALKRAQALEARAMLAEATEAALAHGPDVAPNVVAMQLREATEGVLRAELGTGPLHDLRAELLRNLARNVVAESVPTPYPRLNALLHGGLRGGRLYVLLSPPKAGKTTLAGNCLDFAAFKEHPALYVGYEMAREQMVEYALARRCMIDSRRIEMRNLPPEDAELVARDLHAYLEHEGRFLELWEAGLTTTLADAHAWALKAKAQHPGKTPLIVIDYLQLARTDIRETDGHPSETKRVSEIAVACKDLARQTGAAVLALSSVTKQAETDSKEKGELDVTAARDSLAIIHAADGVLTLQTRSTAGEEGVAVDPWAFLAQQAREQGRENDALTLERALQPERDLGRKYPAHGPAFEGAGSRARLSLVRHRGSTGEVPLYYRRAFHSMEEVELPGLPAHESVVNTESSFYAFRKYAEAEKAPQQGDLAGMAEPVNTESPQGPAVAYQLITSREEAVAAIAELEGLVGLDLETTGLSPLTAQARLLQLADAKGPALVIDLAQVGGLHALRESLAGLRCVAHNATFDMRFLWQAGLRVVPECTMLAAHVLTGKRAKLADLAQQYLGLALDKTQQKADWSGELTEAQLRYAALDAIAVQALLPKLRAELEERESVQAYELARDAQAAVVQMELAGMPFNAAQQRTLIESLMAQKQGLEVQLAEGLNGRNPRSGAQLAEWLAEQLGGQDSAKHKAWPKTPKGQLATGADDWKRGLVYLPEAAERLVRAVLLPFKDVDKKLAAFGDNLAQHLDAATGRIHADFSLAATVTGRMSCSKPNLQQIPRAAEFRGLFAPEEGRAFVIADYSQMELRVAAILAGEETLLQAYREGQDTHRLTASMILGKKPEEITKQERQLAKAVNFGLLYGQGAKGLREYASSSYGVEITEQQARDYRAQWFKAFPAFEAWHRTAAARAEKALAVRTPAGRERRWASRAEFKSTEAFNTPVQGGAAEAMLAALARLPEKLAGLDAVPVAVVHDELIIETAASDAPQVAQAVEAAMVEGMLAIFPEAATAGLVEAHIGNSWADK